MTVEMNQAMSDRRCKVLIVIEATSAGVGRHVTDLTLNLDLERFDVTLAYSPDRLDDRFREGLRIMQDRGIKTVVIPMTRAVKPVADCKALGQLVRLIARERFDVVHGQSSKAGFLARFAAALARRRAQAIYTPNAIAISVNKAYWYPEKIAGWFTDAIVAVTESERRELAGYNIVPSNKIRRIVAGIEPLTALDALAVSRIREEFAVPAEAVLIGTAGRIARQKDPMTFIRTAERVVKSGHPAYFLWLGDGEDRAEVERELTARGLTAHVKFAGYRKDAERILGAVDIFVLTSCYESFGYVTCEAMAHRKPVVATHVTGTCELVEDGVSGKLVQVGDDASFARELAVLIEDPDLRHRFGAAGKDRADRHFSLLRMVRETEQLYLDLLSASSRHSSRTKLMGREVIAG